MQVGFAGDGHLNDLKGVFCLDSTGELDWDIRILRIQC